MRRVGVLTFRDGVGRVVHERREAWIDEERECAWTPSDGPIPLSDVLGAYNTIDEAARDLARCRREADLMGDAEGSPYPWPTEPLVFDVTMHHSPMTSLEIRTRVTISPGDEATRDFAMRRPLFFERTFQRIGPRGSLLTPKLVGEMAYRLHEEIVKRWPPPNFPPVVVRTRVV